MEIDRFPTSCIDQQKARRYDALAVQVDDVISLALAGFFVYAGIRILRSPEHHASIRFQPWTYRRVKHKPTERDVRNAQAVGVLMFALAAAAVVLFVLRVRHA